MHDAELGPSDPLGLHRVPIDQRSVVYPREHPSIDESGRMADATVGGAAPMRWKDAVLRVEKDPSPGPFVTGTERPLRQIPRIADLWATASLG